MIGTLRAQFCLKIRHPQNQGACGLFSSFTEAYPAAVDPSTAAFIPPISGLWLPCL